MMHRKYVFGGLVALFSLFLSSQLFAQADLIEKRQKLMKSNSAANKALKAAVAEKDFATVEIKAKEIMENMEKAPELFPKGSTADKSRAKPDIWEQWDQFTKTANKAKTAAGDLAKAAAAKEEAEVAAKFKALGGTCGECHKPFRAEKKN